jgi:membrane fusion protein (multidrug efflux system)
VHPGQYLNEGTVLTTLQSVDDALHVDFAVPQAVAAGLKPGDRIDVFAGTGSEPIAAKVAALDAKVDPTTRNSTVRARIDLSGKGGAKSAVPVPGSSVRVSVGVGASSRVVSIPATALRKGPSGDHVFVLAPDAQKQLRAQVRPVKVGATVGDEVLIVEGLAAGDQVATSGSFKLRDAVRVAVSQPAPATKTSAAAAAPAGGS